MVMENLLVKTGDAGQIGWTCGLKLQTPTGYAAEIGKLLLALEVLEKVDKGLFSLAGDDKIYLRILRQEFAFQIGHLGAAQDDLAS